MGIFTPCHVAASTAITFFLPATADLHIFRNNFRRGANVFLMTLGCFRRHRRARLFPVTDTVRPRNLEKADTRNCRQYTSKGSFVSYPDQLFLNIGLSVLSQCFDFSGSHCFEIPDVLPVSSFEFCLQSPFSLGALSKVSTKGATFS